MQLNILEAVARETPKARVVAVTSNEVYGAVPPDRLPVDETAALSPSNPYATSKAAQDLLAAQYSRSPGLDVVRIRPFNHIGPGQDARFVAASFARQIAQIEAGAAEPVLRVGDTSAQRDFTDVRDIVRGYYLAATRGLRGAVYNLGSGVAHPIARIVEFMVERCAVPVRVEEDPERMRATDAGVTLCDNRVARHDLGWSPEIPFEQSLADVLDDWRARVRMEAN
jgi:GDP-4-dehydro-6-deoxy-D-mannose reductase